MIMEARWYLGKYAVGVIERVLNKSYVMFLEKGIVGNKKLGYREVEYGEKLFVYTRNCWRERKSENPYRFVKEGLK